MIIGLGRAFIRVTMASAASRLNSALSGTLTARCWTRMETASHTGLPPPIISTRTNLRGQQWELLCEKIQATGFSSFNESRYKLGSGKCLEILKIQCYELTMRSHIFKEKRFSIGQYFRFIGGCYVCTHLSVLALTTDRALPLPSPTMRMPGNRLLSTSLMAPAPSPCRGEHSFMRPR